MSGANLTRSEVLAAVRARGFRCARHNLEYALDYGHMSPPEIVAGRLRVFSPQHVNELVAYLERRRQAKQK